MLNFNSVIGLSLVTFCVGILIPIQAGINAQFGRFLGHPILASFLSFAVASTVLFFTTQVLQLQWPSWERISSCPWWFWLGGLIGAMFITATIIIAPRVGASTMLAIIVAGQMLASLLVDHYGLIGLPHHPASLMRWVGVLLLIFGVFLVQRF